MLAAWSQNAMANDQVSSRVPHWPISKTRIEPAGSRRHGAPAATPGSRLPGAEDVVEVARPDPA